MTPNFLTLLVFSSRRSNGSFLGYHAGGLWARSIGGHGTLQKYHATGTRYFAKISTAVPVLSNQKYRGTFAILFKN